MSEFRRRLMMNKSESTNWVDAGLDSIARTNIFINGTTYKWSTANNWYSAFFPVIADKTYKVVAGNGGVTRYTFLVNKTYRKETIVTTWATGYYQLLPRIGIGEESEELSVPNDALYLHVLVQIGGSSETGVKIYVKE